MKDNLRHIYQVNKLSGQFAGNLNTVPWEFAEKLTEFNYPWEEVESPLLEFRALHDGDWLYCFYNVFDPESSVKSVTNHKNEVLDGDRVEIFLAPDRSLSNYYCLEIDKLGRVYDYKASFYRKFDDKWSWPANHLAVQTKTNATGYQVMFIMSIQSLRDLKLVHGAEMIVGLFRGKCSDTRAAMNSMRWISWSKPESEKPDFHIPSAFGAFLLV